VHEVCFQALYALIESRGFRMQYAAVLIQAIVNGGVGIAAFLLVEKGPDLLQRRHSRRATLSRRRY
jgi:hypothetical protein